MASFEYWRGSLPCTDHRWAGSLSRFLLKLLL